MAPPRRRGKGNTVSVDFSGVEVGGGGKLLPEGEQFTFIVKEIEEKEGEDSKKPYLEVKFAVDGDKEFDGTLAYDNFSLQPQSLWKFRGFLEAAGIQTEDGPMDVDLDELIGVLVKATVVHEDYKGKAKHRLDSYVSVDDDASSSKKDEGGSKKRRTTASESEWKVGQKVTFKDGKKTLPGKITEIDGEKITVAVKGVSKDADGEYELAEEDLSAA